MNRYDWRAMWRAARSHFAPGVWFRGTVIRDFFGLPRACQAWYLHIKSDDIPSWLKVKKQTRQNGQVSRLFMFPPVRITNAVQ
jgi:hypothetical protein